MGVAPKTEVDHLSAFTDSITDSVAYNGRAASTGGVHDTHRKDKDFNPWCAINNSTSDMGSVSVLISGGVIIVNQIDTGEYPSIHFLMVGHTAVHNGDLNRS